MLGYPTPTDFVTTAEGDCPGVEPNTMATLNGGIADACKALGVTYIERHITTDRELWGSDQKASMEPDELVRLVQGVRELEAAMQYPAGERILLPTEEAKKQSLRPATKPAPGIHY